MLSDGKPNDVDAYDGPYGIEDARQAIAEARAQNVDVLSDGGPGSTALCAEVFGQSGFALLRQPINRRADRRAASPDSSVSACAARATSTIADPSSTLHAARSLAASGSENQPTSLRHDDKRPDEAVRGRPSGRPSMRADSRRPALKILHVDQAFFVVRSAAARAALAIIRLFTSLASTAGASSPEATPPATPETGSGVAGALRGPPGRGCRRTDQHEKRDRG